ncbi:stemmadenine O-acetyltransferase-like isoform X2 [Andrographis paniculata]|nr:stemmadenine O-acetyltransferase-like isoform X2 [Andrographis paniculata]
MAEDPLPRKPADRQSVLYFLLGRPWLLYVVLQMQSTMSQRFIRYHETKYWSRIASSYLMSILSKPPGSMSSMQVQRVSKELIRPSSPTPNHLRNFQRSFIDERIPPLYIPLVIYYNLNEGKGIVQSQMSCRLKSSLSDALVHFYPLAGRLKGQASVDCNDKGIVYMEAVADGRISEVVKTADSLILDKLVPFNSNASVTKAEELLAIQVTWFDGGGIAVGICISHSVADVCTLSSFVECWTSIASGEASRVVYPAYNSAKLFPPQNTPDFTPNWKSPAVQPHSVKLAMKRFTFTSYIINELKMKVKEGSSIVRPTRIEVLSAFLWSRCLMAKNAGKSHKSVAYHPVNLRGRIKGLTQHSFGNNFQMAKAENDGETNWILLVEKLRTAFSKINSEYTEKLLGEKGFNLTRDSFIEMSKLLVHGNVEVFRFSSYCRFEFYRADFGWGKPVWVSSASYESRDCILLFDSIESQGGIDAWIIMADEDMARLEQDIDIHQFTTPFLPPYMLLSQS